MALAKDAPDAHFVLGLVQFQVLPFTARGAIGIARKHHSGKTCIIVIARANHYLLNLSANITVVVTLVEYTIALIQDAKAF